MMAGKTAKQLKAAKRREEKKARLINPNVDECYPVWHLGSFDDKPDWCSKCHWTEKVAKDVFERLMKLSDLKWSEIKGGEHHSVEINLLISDAQKRLRDLGMVDIERLFSIRVNGEQRIWGVLQRNEFHILWWDPEHKVCESKLKHT